MTYNYLGLPRNDILPEHFFMKVENVLPGRKFAISSFFWVGHVNPPVNTKDPLLQKFGFKVVYWLTIASKIIENTSNILSDPKLTCVYLCVAVITIVM